ncbi:MAG: hypothetical protein JHC33_02800 [Ignisphaera sp.]|jgi:hypothetical protein|nr:hypothetical protein [Ignisphaera sp.]
MRLVRLELYGVVPVVATPFKNKRNNRLYYNIQHGIKDTTHNSKTWKYVCELRINDFIPENESDTISLSNNNYTFKPVRHNGETVKDLKGNNVYIVGINNAATDKNDVIVFWEIPNKYYTDVKYTITGDCSIIGLGVNGKERDGKIYTSPAPVVEVLGDCILYWSGKTENNTIITQTIKYNHKNGSWDVPPTQEHQHLLEGE